MLFSEFADIMYKHCGSSYKPHEYFLCLFDSIMADPVTPEDIKKSAEDKYNPFGKLVPDTLDRLFKGTNPLNPKKVHFAINHVDSDKFARYIDTLGWESQRGIEEDFKKRLPDFNPDDNLPYACADLFLQIMDDIYEGRETSSPITNPYSINIPKIKKYPATTVYFDETDSKIHIGDVEIYIPQELFPPDTVAPEEDIYISKLLMAYANALSKDSLSLNDIDSLPPKYRRNFTDQRINYYSAVRIDRFVRESIAGGDSQSMLWKSDTYDYIKDTLWDDYDNGYKRLVSVMQKVVDCSTTSVVDTFQNLVGSKEKKGVCHLLANDGRVYWVDDDE